jgi:hypothetical protein
MKKLFATLAVLISAASPVHANPAYKALNRSPLSQMVERTGTRIVYDTQLCQDRGMLGYYRPSTDVMGICVSNHDGDWKELGDTLRHESIHVAQACNLFVIELLDRTFQVLAYDAEDAAWQGVQLATEHNSLLVDIQPIDETNG